MKENKSNESRRKLLKSIAAGSGAVIAGKSLPENWTKPVVDSVLLPAHAQTSPAPPTCPYSIAVTVFYDIVDGTEIPNGGVMDVGVDDQLLLNATVTPPPGDVDISWIARRGDGTTLDSGTPTSSNGVISNISVDAASVIVGSTISIEVSYDCASTVWTANVIDSTPG